MILLRESLGDALRRSRQRQSRTLRDVAATARVSLGYLSEVERGRKEASSELLASICGALDVSLAEILAEVSTELRADQTTGAAPAVEAGPAATTAPATATAQLRIAA
jgi:transcriptional regulator with XRE-family HTH domain